MSLGEIDFGEEVERILKPSKEEAREEIFRRLSEENVTGLARNGEYGIFYEDDKSGGTLEVLDVGRVGEHGALKKAYVCSTNPERIRSIMADTEGNYTIDVKSF